MMPPQAVPESWVPGSNRLPLLDRLATLPPAVLLGSVVLLFLAAELWALSDETATYDEVAHLGAGYSYLLRADYRMNTEHPPLGKLLSALPLLGLRVHWPADEAHWNHANEWWFGYVLLYQSGNDPGRLLFFSRLPTVAWGIVLLLTVYSIARSFYGARGGLVALVLCAFCPTLLAHGHLVTTDVPVATLYVLTVAAFWRLYQNITLSWSLVSGILLGGSLGAKYSAVTLIPVLGFMALLAQLRPGAGVRILGTPRDPGGIRIGRDLLRLASGIGVASGAAYLTLWGLYGFRFDCSTSDFHPFWTPEAAPAGATATLVRWSMEHKFLPEAFLVGFSSMYDSAQQRLAFAFGKMSETGWWWYFPAALLVKTPVATLALYGLGLISFLKRKAEESRGDDYLIVPVVFFWILALSSRINIGIRHIYPTLPFLVILAGGVDWPKGLVGTRRRSAALLLGLLSLTVVDVLFSSPYYIAYFNFPARAIALRERMLVDSNLDWGQDLGRLRTYLQKHGIPSVKLAYFGTASPRAVGLVHEVLPATGLYIGREKEWPRARDLRAFDWVAVSATTYAGIASDHRDFYRNLLGGLEPEERIGHSILLYHLPAGWKRVSIPVYR